WADFLRTAAWNYKYPFQDQLLIYAQRPDATACAPIDVWNKRLDRWVKRGAKGIALIEDRGNHLACAMCLTYRTPRADASRRCRFGDCRTAIRLM
uniref:hypothetical protein n=1 Tax=Gordoniibacillus kamchatkensis TaxID=1590651 RepID=UPI003204699D